MSYVNSDVVPVVTFPCVVNAKKLTAEFSKSILHPVYHVFHVKFSDGFEDLFHNTAPGFWEGERSGKSSYAWAVRNDLDTLIAFEIDKAYFLVPWTIQNEMVNVWILEKNDDEIGQVFYVYYNGDYRFELRKEKDRWLSRTRRKISPEPVLQDLADAITKVIDSHLY